MACRDRHFREMAAASARAASSAATSIHSRTSDRGAGSVIVGIE
jgi:hypothetical protein